MQTTMEGGCHCGRVRFRVTADFGRVSDCNCSICTKKGFLHLIVPPAQFQLVSGKDDLTTYEFNTKTAKHTFCKHCGIHPFYVPRSDPDKIDVNVRCLDNINLAAIAPKPFDGKDWEAAMQKRAPWRQALLLPPLPEKLPAGQSSRVRDEQLWILKLRVMTSIGADDELRVRNALGQRERVTSRLLWTATRLPMLMAASRPTGHCLALTFL